LFSFFGGTFFFLTGVFFLFEIVTDLSSPAILETLWLCSSQSKKIVLAFCQPELIRETLSQMDPTILSFVNLFSNERQLMNFFQSLFNKGTIESEYDSKLNYCGDEARTYFETTYGRPVDDLFVKLSQQRHWNDVPSNFSKSEQMIYRFLSISSFLLYGTQY
jgi:hypothetical protein